MSEEDEDSPEYEIYAQTEERVSGYFKQNLIKRIQDEAKAHIGHRNLSSREVFDEMGKLDPGYEFYLTNIADLEKLFHFLGIKTSPHELVFLANYYCSSEKIRYFKFIQTIFPARDLIECVIAKAVDNYDSFKEFFQAQVEGREYWKADGIREFLEIVDAPFEKADVNQTVEAWSGPHKTSVKYDEIYKVFKPILGMSMSFTNFNKSKSKIGEGGKDEASNEPPLRGMMEHLKEKEPDLQII